jgi:hypothetical protein
LRLANIHKLVLKAITDIYLAYLAGSCGVNSGHVHIALPLSDLLEHTIFVEDNLDVFFLMTNQQTDVSKSCGARVLE